MAECRIPILQIDSGCEGDFLYPICVSDFAAIAIIVFSIVSVVVIVVEEGRGAKEILDVEETKGRRGEGRVDLESFAEECKAI